MVALEAVHVPEIAEYKALRYSTLLNAKTR